MRPRETRASSAAPDYPPAHPSSPTPFPGIFSPPGDYQVSRPSLSGILRLPPPRGLSPPFSAGLSPQFAVPVPPSAFMLLRSLASRGLSPLPLGWFLLSWSLSRPFPAYFLPEEVNPPLPSASDWGKGWKCGCDRVGRSFQQCCHLLGRCTSTTGKWMYVEERYNQGWMCGACTRVQPVALCSVCGKISAPFLRCYIWWRWRRAHLDQCFIKRAWLGGRDCMEKKPASLWVSLGKVQFTVVALSGKVLGWHCCCPGVKAGLDSFCLGLQGSWLRLLISVEEEADRYLLLKLWCWCVSFRLSTCWQRKNVCVPKT